MLGSLPAKPAYFRCQGKVDVRIVALPPVQAASVALLMKPNSASLALVIVPEWNEPSRVTLHLTVNPPDVNSIGKNSILTAWLL